MLDTSYILFLNKIYYCAGCPSDRALKVILCLPEELLFGISIGHSFQTQAPEFFPSGEALKSLTSVLVLSVCDKADSNIS